MKLFFLCFVSFAIGCAPAVANRNDDERVARLEHRLDKVIQILEQAMPPSEPDPAARYAVPIDPRDPQEGPHDAKVTIVEGFEFLCPYCFMANATVDQILAKYPHDVRLVSKYMVIHGAAAVPPALAACAAAKQGKLKEMKAAIWSHLWGGASDRPSLDKDEAAPEALTKTAAKAGLNATKLEADMHGADCAAWLHDSEEVLRAFNAGATPAFFINGRFVAGAQSFEAFDKVVQEELATASRVNEPDYYQREVVAKGLKKVKSRFDD